VWLKCVVVALPFVSVAVDVSSWYITKIYHPFAWVVMAAGTVMGMCFGFMWVVSMYQLWFSRTPSAVTQRSDGEVSVG
jgi:hypothetical protein